MSCRKGMPVRGVDRPGCKRDCLHRAMVRDYAAAREAAELAREKVAAGYPAETKDHGPILTFRSWLGWIAGARQEAAA